MSSELGEAETYTWAAIVSAFTGLVLASLAVRTAVTALSPIAEVVGRDIALTSVGMGLIGALPLGAFALAGLLTPTLLKRGSLEGGMVLAIALLTVGQAGRALAPNYGLFFSASVLSFLSIGIMTVLIPPLIKRYFRESQALLTAVYAAGLSISLMAPATFSPMLVENLGWRGVMWIWAGAGALTLAPWSVLSVMTWLRHRPERTLRRSPRSKGYPISRGFASRSAWLLALALATTALNAFVTFAWLPTILRDLIGLTTEESGILLGLFALWGFPLAIVIPWMVKKWNRPGEMMQVGSLLFIGSYLGLLFAPGAAPWLWVTLSGIGTLIFPLVLVLVNHWSRTENGATLLTASMQAIGYTIAVAWPVIIGVTHDLTSDWKLPIILLLGTAIVGVAIGHSMKRWEYVEDELERTPPLIRKEHHELA